MRILVIEDNESFGLMLCAALREEGFEADNALSGKAGIKMSLAYNPDLILLDYHLGDMTGYDVAIALRCARVTAATPFILLSSLGGDPLLIGSFKKLPNCRAVLVKTLPLHEITAGIKQALGCTP